MVNVLRPCKHLRLVATDGLLSGLDPSKQTIRDLQNELCATRVRALHVECLGFRHVQQIGRLAGIKEMFDWRQATNSSIVPREKSEVTDSS